MVAPWRACSVEERLEEAGVLPRRSEHQVRQPGSRVPGVVYSVGNAELHIYLHSDSAGAAAAVASFDPARAAQPVGDVAYTLPPVAFASGNLAAVLYARTERQGERVRLALTAGLPAP